MNKSIRCLGLASAATMGLLAFATAPAQAGFQWTAPVGQASTAPVGTTGTLTPNRPFEAAPRAAASPVAPVMSESLPSSLGTINTAQPVATTPDGPANAAPIYGQGMTNDPITWNPNHNSRTAAAQGNAAGSPRGPQNFAEAANITLNGGPEIPIGNPVLGPTLGAPVPAAGAPMPLGAPNNTMMAAAQGSTVGMSPGMYAVADGFGRDLPLVMAIRQIVPAQYGFVFDQNIDISNHVSWQGGQPWDVVLQNTLTPLGMQATIRGNVVTIGRQGGAMMNSGMGQGFQTAAYTPGPQVSTNMMQSSTTQQMAPAPLMQPAAMQMGGQMGNMQAGMPVAPQSLGTLTPAAGSNMMMEQPVAQPVGLVPGMQAPAVDDMSGTTGYYNAASAPSVTDLNAAVTWTAARNSSLRTILEDWSQRVGVELYWASEYDYPIQSSVSINGTFEEAVQTLLKGLTESKPRPMGRLHPNLPNGPAVLVIETRQNSM